MPIYPFYTEHWPPFAFEDRESKGFFSLSEAEDFARVCADRGEHARVLSEESTFEPEQIDLCEYNGVTPGVDFPASLHP
ncbi:MAG: hypothetical protein LUG19_12490 [Desulfovibrio sp.]|uniref:hypothetical protein n=1 Tax=Desulfovibrio sp. TaxID=885 RepID=UPI00258A74F1|nr:hypothetical protein [Desulfovibrio sp.]MCD7985048.1 hypothetical protein [Desulfovibrio sp.]